MTETATKYRLTINYDHGTESPNEYGVVRVVSFNRHHNDFAHPDTIDPADILAPLSYYEHGDCVWSVGASTVPDHGGFDTVNYAGAIVWNTEDLSEREWFNSLSETDRLATFRSVADQYTDWCNGTVFYYLLETMVECELGYDHVGGFIDQCGSFIGNDSLIDAVAEALTHENIDPYAVTVVGDASYTVEPYDLARKMAGHKTLA